jgi:1-acyl-sn-glycerol-3-phosphate acyltransferase
MAMKFLRKFILKPNHEIVKGIRGFMDKIGILDPIDQFIYKNIEDPLYYLWFTQAYGFEIINDEVIPLKDEGCCLFATNHQTIMDPLICGLAIIHNSKRMAFKLTKAELGDDPMLGNFVSMNQVIYIRRGENDQEALDKCVQVMVEDNRPVLVYPEGTYGPGNGEMLPFKTGAVRLAWDAEVPVIPMAVHGADKILPGSNFKAFKNKGVKLKVKFGDRLNLSELFPNKKVGDQLKQQDFQKATEKVQKVVQQLWDSMEAESNLEI